MSLPYLKTDTDVSRRVVSGFGGYDHQRVIGEGELYDEKNLSSDRSPLLSARKPRGTVKALTKPQGLFFKEKLCYADGTALWYGDQVIGVVSDTPKTFVGMGAYLLIFPDKLCYNTASGELLPLEAKYVSGAGEVSFTSSSIKTTGAAFEGFKAYDAVTISGTAEEKNAKTAVILAVSEKELTFSDEVFAAGSDTGVVTIERKVPELSFAVESGNRVWGCSGHEIRASKLGDPFNWEAYEGLSTDAYAVTVGTDGDFTGAAVHQGYVLFFKEGCVHKIYGSKPQNFQVSAVALRGVKKGCEKSLCQVDGVLYYLSPSGLMAYGGGTPESLAAPFGGVSYGQGVGGCLGGKYYLSMQEEATGLWDLFVYDGDKGILRREDRTHALWMAAGGSELYYVDAADKKIKTVVGDDEERVLWEADFGDQTEGDPDFKTVLKLQLSLELERGSFCDVWLKYDGEALWERAFSIPASIRRKSHTVPVIPRRYGAFALKLTGGGDFMLFSVTRTVERGSDLGG